MGVAPIGPYFELEKILNDRKQKEHLTGMEEEDINKRIDPRLENTEILIYQNIVMERTIIL